LPSSTMFCSQTKCLEQVALTPTQDITTTNLDQETVHAEKILMYFQSHLIFFRLCASDSNLVIAASFLIISVLYSLFILTYNYTY